VNPSLDELAQRVTARLDDAASTGRVMIGITGSPGAGKTTLAQRLVARLGEDLGPDQVAYVPMDGYHLADVELDRIGLRDRKGAPATFDVFGYLALLRRLRENADPLVYVPGFDRLIEQPIAGSFPVFQVAHVIVTEGNYLLLDGGWAGVRPLLDEIWFCRGDEALRLERLLARHIRFGKSEEFARTWIDQTDRPNADLIEATAARADLQIDAD
jgi:pantothenate kinase